MPPAWPSCPTNSAPLHSPDQTFPGIGTREDSLGWSPEGKKATNPKHFVSLASHKPTSIGQLVRISQGQFANRGVGVGRGDERIVAGWTRPLEKSAPSFKDASIHRLPS